MAISLDNSKKSMTTLYTTESCIEGHACRIVLCEKEIECDVKLIDNKKDLEILDQLNPYGESPVLVDRDLVLYGSHIIAEYLDDRLPHPPLMPPDPFSRGQVRLMVYRFQRDWLHKLRDLSARKQKPTKKVSAAILQEIVSFNSFLNNQEFLLGEEISLADCFFIALLWKLPSYGMEIPKQARGLLSYKSRLFMRESFKQSLCLVDRDMLLHSI